MSPIQILVINSSSILPTSGAAVYSSLIICQQGFINPFLTFSTLIPLIIFLIFNYYSDASLPANLLVIIQEETDFSYLTNTLVFSTISNNFVYLASIRLSRLSRSSSSYQIYLSKLSSFYFTRTFSFSSLSQTISSPFVLLAVAFFASFFSLFLDVLIFLIAIPVEDPVKGNISYTKYNNTIYSQIVLFATIYIQYMKLFRNYIEYTRVNSSSLLKQIKTSLAFYISYSSHHSPIIYIPITLIEDERKQFLKIFLLK